MSEKMMPERIWVEPITGQQPSHAPSQYGLWHPSHDRLRIETQYVRADLYDKATAERDTQKAQKDAAYLERNKLVALLASLFPSGIAKTAIEGWSEDWHGCVYIDFPGFQASWHYHDSQAYLFEHLPPYEGSWDGHTTEEKYEKIVARAKELLK